MYNDNETSGFLDEKCIHPIPYYNENWAYLITLLIFILLPLILLRNKRKSYHYFFYTLKLLINLSLSLLNSFQFMKYRRELLSMLSEEHLSDLIDYAQSEHLSHYMISIAIGNEQQQVDTNSYSKFVSHLKLIVRILLLSMQVIAALVALLFTIQCPLSQFAESLLNTIGCVGLLISTPSQMIEYTCKETHPRLRFLVLLIIEVAVIVIYLFSSFIALRLNTFLVSCLLGISSVLS